MFKAISRSQGPHFPCEIATKSKKVSEKHIAIHSNTIRAYQRGSRRSKAPEGALNEDNMNLHFDSVMAQDEVNQGMDILVLTDFDNPKNEGDLFEIVDDEDEYIPTQKNRNELFMAEVTVPRTSIHPMFESLLSSMASSIA